jgi:hypothetical protein
MSDEAIYGLASSITPVDAGPGVDATGGTITSLTEAVMGITSALLEIADAINNLASAVENREELKGSREAQPLTLVEE